MPLLAGLAILFGSYAWRRGRTWMRTVMAAAGVALVVYFLIAQTIGPAPITHG